MPSILKCPLLSRGPLKLLSYFFSFYQIKSNDECWGEEKKRQYGRKHGHHPHHGSYTHQNGQLEHLDRTGRTRTITRGLE